ncbi:MAG: insulinase family protein, partial [bacterium]|nr:insulinase family protein [bacterium]
QTLDNGLRVVVMEDHSAPIAAIQVWYHVGSKDEHPERTGFAHMFEHMMFRGTDRIGPEDHFKYLRRFGGMVNGYTTWDTTVYIQEVPSNQVDLTFWLEAERMANLKINEEYFAEERDVVKEEYRLRVSDPPYGTLMHKALPFVFTEHPYKWSPIGNLDHLNAATAVELRQFFDTYYVPNNATLVVVGDVTTSEIMAKARRYFGWVPRAADPPRVTVREPPVTEPRRLEVKEEKGPLAIVGLGYHVMQANHPDRHALAILDNVLSGGESGRVYKKLVKDLEIAMVAISGSFLLDQDGLWACGAVVKLGGEPEKVEAALIEEIEKVLAEGITERELQKSRNQVAVSTVLEQTTVAGKARRLGYAAVVLDDIDQVNKEYEDLMKVTREDVLAAARKYLDPQKRMTLVVRPVSIKERIGGFFDKFLPKKKTKSDADEKTKPAPAPDPKKKDTDK